MFCAKEKAWKNVQSWKTFFLIHYSNTLSSYHNGNCVSTLPLSTYSCIKAKLAFKQTCWRLRSRESIGNKLSRSWSFLPWNSQLHINFRKVVYGLNLQYVTHLVPLSQENQFTKQYLNQGLSCPHVSPDSSVKPIK